MNKMIRHNIGDEVIALTNPPDNDAQPRVKGQKYIVHDVMYCKSCGLQSINIGQYLSVNNNVLCECDSVQNGDSKHWTHSIYFVKPEDVNEMLEEAISNENFELAVILRDFI